MAVLEPNGNRRMDLSIKNAPDQVVQLMRERSAADVMAEIRRLSLRTPSESAALIRADRDRN